MEGRNPAVLWGIPGQNGGENGAQNAPTEGTAQDPVAGTARLKPADQIAHESRPRRAECEVDWDRIPPARIRSSAKPL